MKRFHLDLAGLSRRASVERAVRAGAAGPRAAGNSRPLCGGRAHPAPGGDPFGGIVQVSGEAAGPPQTQTGALCVFWFGRWIPAGTFFLFKNLLSFSSVLVSFSLPKPVFLGHTSPVEGSRLQAPAVGREGTQASGSGFVPALPLLTRQAFVPRVSPSSFVTWGASASRPK